MRPGVVTSAAIKTRASELGFDLCGVAPAMPHAELEAFWSWLAAGRAGSMAYLARTARMRADARHVLPAARSVIVTATNYNTDRPYSIESADPGRARIARYAWGDDYHEVIGGRQARLLAWMHQTSPEPFQAVSYVDTGPVQERVYARHAGIGWLAKNTCVINERLGSWILLGVIITSLELETDQPAFDQCGTCTLCLEACPTQAFVGPGVLDATRCISYLTIEHRGALPPALATAIGSHIYGCDVCQEVCPWNQGAPRSDDPTWAPRPVWDAPAFADLERLTDDQLCDGLRGSSMRRAKVDGLRRNIAAARQNAAR